MSDDLRLLLWYWGRRGGGAQYTCALAEGLVEVSGLEVRASVSNRLESLDRLRAVVPHPHVVRLDRSLRSFPLLVPGPTSFGSIVGQMHCSVVLHTMVNPLTPVAWPRRRGIRVATVIHDASPHVGDTAGAIERASRFAQRRSDLLIAPSEAVKAELRERHPRAAIETVALPSHMTLPDLYDPAGSVLFFGRLAHYKGLDLLAQAWRMLSPSDRPLLRIVGEAVGDVPALAELRSFGAQVEERWVPDSDIASVLSKTRLVVLPYREASQSGVITLAHAAGIPLLVTDVGGLRSQVGPSGMVVAPTPEALGDGLRQLLEAASYDAGSGSGGGVTPPTKKGLLEQLRAEAVRVRSKGAADSRALAEEMASLLVQLNRRK